MAVCVFTTLHHPALEYMLHHSPDQPAWFSSNRRWKRAAEELRRQRPLPVLIRAIGDSASAAFTCTYVADLENIRFREDIGATSRDRRRWLLRHKAFQRRQRLHHPDREQRWSRTKFLAREIEPVVNDATHFRLNHLRPIEPIPLGRLKRAGKVGQLASQFKYGYAICEHPRGAIRPVTRPLRPESEPDSDQDEELAAFEGEIRKLFIRHRRRERRLRQQKLEQARRAHGGRLKCEVPGCGFDFAAVYGQPGEGYAQVHHLRPLSDSTAPQLVRMQDLAVVCANCHVVIHRGGQCRPLTGLIRRRHDR